MAQLSRYSEILHAGKLRFGQHLLERLQGTATMERHPRIPPLPIQDNGLHRQGTDVHTRARHNSFSGDARHQTLLPILDPSPTQ